MAILLFAVLLVPIKIAAQEQEQEEDLLEVVALEEDTLGTDVLARGLRSEDFVVPEALNVSVDSLLHVYNTEKYLTLDSDCDFEDVNPVVTAEEVQERLSRLPTVVELPYNSVVAEYIDRYAGRMRRSVSIILGVANFYQPIFEEALEAYGLPLELEHLPVIESALNPTAVSRAGATGLWQFMLTTGKQYGLEVNSLVDERMDPVKASYAAAHYLSDLYKIFGDWTLAIAAYNCGPENVNKAIHRAAGEKDFWKIYPYLPRETRGYIPAFIAANYIMNYYLEHNICPMVASLPLQTDTITLSRDVHFDQIAEVIGVDKNVITSLNPQYRRSVINGSTHPSTLRLPTKDIMAFIDNQDTIYTHRASELLTKRAVTAVNEATYSPSSRSSKGKRKSASRGGGAKSVTIRKGDTLSAIAKRNGTTVAQLKRLNPSIKGTKVIAGKKIRVK